MCKENISKSDVYTSDLELFCLHILFFSEQFGSGSQRVNHSELELFCLRRIFLY